MVLIRHADLSYLAGALAAALDFHDRHVHGCV